MPANHMIVHGLLYTVFVSKTKSTLPTSHIFIIFIYLVLVGPFDEKAARMEVWRNFFSFDGLPSSAFLGDILSIVIITSDFK